MIHWEFQIITKRQCFDLTFGWPLVMMPTLIPMSSIFLTICTDIKFKFRNHPLLKASLTNSSYENLINLKLNCMVTINKLKKISRLGSLEAEAHKPCFQN